MRDLDGFYFRVYRGEKYINVCFSDLTEHEMHYVLRDKNTSFLTMLCIGLAKVIQVMGDER